MSTTDLGPFIAREITELRNRLAMSQHALEQRLAVVVGLATELATMVQLRGCWLEGEQQIWVTLNEECRWLEDRLAALEGTRGL